MSVWTRLVAAYRAFRNPPAPIFSLKFTLPQAMSPEEFRVKVESRTDGGPVNARNTYRVGE